jgi:hypothetical protein
MISRRLSMRRTTIFRSSRVGWTAAALVFAAANLSAQVSTGTEQQTQGPTVHVVQTGETLWDLAQTYLGDPFLWPEIYRFNTTVVEDPHWIFPGEELWLGPRGEEPTEIVAIEPTELDTAQAQQVDPPPEQIAPPTPPPVAPPPPPTETAPTVFQRPPPQATVAARQSSAAYRYRPVRRGEFYAAGFLTEGESLPWASVVGRVGKAALPSLPASSDGMIHGEVDITAPSGAAYQVGDSLLVTRLTRRVDQWGTIVVPTGIVRVTNVAGSSVRARIVTQFDRVTDAQSAIPLETFDDPGYVVPVPVENGSMGEILAVRDIEAMVGPQDIVFVNLGRSDGVALGDVFEILDSSRPGAGGAAQPWVSVGILHIVHVREHTASGFVLNVNDTGIGTGTPVRLIRKMPS